MRSQYQLQLRLTNYNTFASVDDGSCSVFVVEGCAYTDADNYDVSANTDDGSCLFTLGSFLSW